MARLVLHVGSHKTGTSALQRAFHFGRETLAQNGVIYPDVGPNAGHHMLGLPLGIMPSVAPGDSLPEHPEALWDEHVLAHAGGPGTVVVSAEALCRQDPAAVDWANLAPRLRPFESVEVLYVMRDQVSFLQSLWTQVGKDLRPPAWQRYLGRALTEHKASGVWLDHGRFYDNLLKGFPAEAIHFASFDTVRRHPEGMVGWMLDHLGLELDPGARSALTERHNTNVSPDPLAAWVLARLDPSSRLNPAMLAIVLNILRSEFGEDMRGAAYTPAEAGKVISEFAALNDALAERLAPQQPDLTMPALRLPDSWTPRSRLSPRFWARLSRAIFNRPRG